MTEPREQAAARILEEAGHVTHPDGSERTPTDEPHPFDKADHRAGADPDGSADEPESQPEPEAEQPTDQESTSSELSGEEEAGESQETDGEAGLVEPDEAQRELDLSGLAEALEISVEDLYKMEIPLGGEDGSFTLGDVKDSWRDLEQLDQAKENLVQDRTDSENEKLVARQELQTVVALLGDSISPELVDHARRQMQAEIVRERELLFHAIPEWNDHEVAQRDRTAINEFLRGYGFSTAELAQVYDHRLLKLARDSQRNQGTLRNAAEQATPRRKLPGKPGKQQSASAVRRARKRKLINAAASGGPDEKLAAVSSLLSGD